MADSKCVYVAKDGAVANMVAGMLTGAGFPAEVMSEATAGGGDVTGFSQGMQVWVLNPDHVEPARQFLEEELRAAEAEKAKRAARTGTVTATCEDCGKSSEWPASVMGTTENCPHCGAYMDIPDPDDDWSGVDFGTEDEGEEEAKG